MRAVRVHRRPDGSNRDERPLRGRADPDACRGPRGRGLRARVERLYRHVGGRRWVRHRRGRGIGRSGWRCCGRGRPCRRNRRGGRLRCGRRLGRRGRAGNAAKRKEPERVDVRLGDPDPDAQMDVRDEVLGLPRRAWRREHVALRDRLPSADPQLAEVRQGRLVVAGRDRHREAVDRHGSGERHRAGHRRSDHGHAGQRDVDATVLTRRVRVAADGEAAEHGAVGGPCPCHCRRSRRECTTHRATETGKPLRCLRSEHGATVARAGPSGNRKLPSCYREPR